MSKVFEAVRKLCAFGELSTSNLGNFLSPAVDFNIGSRRTIARRIVSELKRLNYIRSKPLSSGAELHYLSSKGAKLAREIGEICVQHNSTNLTSASWQHDAYVAQMIYAITADDMENFVTEHQLISIHGVHDDRPDGVVKFRDKYYLLEIERTKKTGPHMRKQVDRVQRAINEGIDYGDVRVTGAIICYPRNSAGINHRTRIINALHANGLINQSDENLILIGFNVANATHAKINLIEEVDGFNLSALRVEFGLPARVPTGQIIAARKKYDLDSVELQRDDIYSPSCYFTISNLRVDILAHADENEVYEVIVAVDTKHAFSNSYDPEVTIDDAILDVLKDIKRLRQDESGLFLSPQSSYQ